MTFSPCFTKARFSPVSGTTSQTVAMATRSRKRRRSGSATPFAVNQSRRRSSRLIAVSSMKVTPAAHRCPRPELSPGRFALTMAKACGVRASIM
ncbi:MAG: hypothetical protein QM698_02410 [Micropepsaceae bacterium]